MAVEYKVYELENGEITKVKAGSDAEQDLIDGGAWAVRIPGLDQATSNDGLNPETPTTNPGVVSHTHDASDISSLKSIHDAGRINFSSDERWISSADDNYAFKNLSNGESGGTGTDPIYEWEHLGYLFNQGDKLKNFYLAGRTNNTQIEDIRIRFVLVYPTAGWDSAYDNDSENTVVQVSEFLWKDQSAWTETRDLHRKEFNFNDFVVPENAMLKIYWKPVGDLTGTRYFYGTWRITYE